MALVMMSLNLANLLIRNKLVKQIGLSFMVQARHKFVNALQNNKTLVIEA